MIAMIYRIFYTKFPNNSFNFILIIIIKPFVAAHPVFNFMH